MWQDNGAQILELIDFPSFYLTTWIMCGLEGPCFSTQILVDTLKFLVKYGLFNHAYIYDMINYGEIWTDLAQDGALFVAIHHFLYVTPWSTAGGRWSAATLMSFLVMNEPKYQGISQTTCWRILSLLKTWMSIKLYVYIHD